MKKAKIELKGERINYNITTDISGMSLTETFNELKKIIEPVQNKHEVCNIVFFEVE